MLKRKPILKWTLLTLTSLLIATVAFGIWFINLIPFESMKEHSKKIKSITPSDLPYLTENNIPKRGKILAVVTSSQKMGNSNKATGYELTELSRAYYVFTANGFEVDIASPLGGEPPVIVDNDDMGEYDYAFLNDSIAQQKAKHTIALRDVIAEEYQAVFFAGGKGAMFDFPNDPFIQSIVREYYQSNKVVGAVCHGPAALVNVTLDNGRPLIEGKQISSFTNKEELLLIPDAASVFPFLLQSKMEEQGAKFNEGTMYLEQISHDRNLVTGQNPWSTWGLAETMIKQLGYAPKHRVITAEENTIKVLEAYDRKGVDGGKVLIDQMLAQEDAEIARELIVMHSIMAGIKIDIGDFFGLARLASYAKSQAIE